MAQDLRSEDLVVGEGWLSARYGRVQCAYVGPHLDARSFDALAEQLARDIDTRGTHQRIGVLYYTPETAAMDSPRRRRIAKILNERKEQLQRTTAAYALATSSPFVRGVLSTLFWMAPPGYPYKVVATPEQGLDFIAEHLHGVAPAAIAGAFEQLVSEQLRAAS